MTTVSDRRRLFAAIAVALVTFAYAVALSQWLEVTPTGVLWNRDNVLFDADTEAVGRVLLGEARPQFPRRHPLAEVIWVPIVSVVRWVLALVFPGAWAGVLAVRFVMAGLTALGYGLLAGGALSRGASIAGVSAVLGLALASTSMTLVVAPEFYGLSHGLLAIAAGVSLAPFPPTWRVCALLVLAVIAGGTTVTNVLFPLGLAAAVSLSHVTLPEGFRRRLPRLAVLVAGVGLIGAAVLVLGPLRVPLQETRAGAGVGKSTHYRLITDPASAARFAVNGLIFPIVGPAPDHAEARRVQLTYNSRSVLDLSVLQAAASVAWIALLALAIARALRDSADRVLVVVMIGWVLGNLVVHNLWGYEMMLYAPHYSVAFLTLAFIGAARLSLTTLLPLAGVIAIGQVQTLLQLIQALPTD